MDADVRVVGIGASSGGVDALERFFKACPADLGLCYVVIQHLLPSQKSQMPGILAACTTMPVQEVDEARRIEADRVFLIPPDRDLTLEGDRLILEPRPRPDQTHLPVDKFFGCLARSQADRAIAVVLSGQGSDGTRGAQEIREAGGLVFAQDPETADYRSMPASVIQANLADYVRSPDQVPSCLKEALDAQKQGLPEPALEEESAREDLIALRKAVLNCSSLDLGWFKPSTLRRRISRRMALTHCPSLPRYAQYVGKNASEALTLSRELLIGVTKFFRDPDAFAALRSKVLFEMVGEAAANDTPLRIWDVGCATGEEAYSLAILLWELREEHGCRSLPIKIFATDVNARAIRYACEGRYPDSIRRELSLTRLKRFFTGVEGGLRVNSDLRRMVVFAEHNAVSDPPFGRMNLVVCRNLLIYFQPEAQQRLIRTFQFSLQEGQTLMLGPSESPGASSPGFETIDGKWKIYRNCIEVRMPVHGQFGGEYLGSDRQGKPGGDGVAESGLVGALPQGQEALFNTLVKGYIPAAVVVDADHVVQHVLGDVENILSLPTGRAELNLLKMVTPEMGTTLSAGLHRCRNGGQEVLYKRVPVSTDEKMRKVDIRIRPVLLGRGVARFWIIYFDPSAGPDPQVPEVQADPAQGRKDYRDLQKELHSTRESLQATIEEMESGNEELQAANEELVVSNEELQTTNEELHSVNEELYTVNEEYQRKIEELSQLTEDLDNITRTNEVGTIFLDGDLNIRKFTSPAQSFVHVLDQDLSRPFAHLSHDLIYPDLQADIETVRDRGKRVEKSVETSEGSRALVRIDPYRDSRRRKNPGVVLTFVDITELDRVRRQRDRARRRYQETFDLAAAGIVHADPNGRFLKVNPRFAEMLGYQPEEMEGMNFRRITDSEDLPLSEQVVEDLVSGRRDRLSVRKNYLRKDGSRLPALLTTRFVREGQEGYFLSVIQDMTDREEAEAARQDLAAIVESTDSAVYSVDAEGRILSWNSGACRLFGYSADQALGSNIEILQDRGHFESLREVLARVRQGESIRRHVTSALDSRGRAVWVSLAISPIRGSDGSVLGASFIAEDLTEQMRIFQRLEQMPEYVGAVWNQPGRLHCVVDLEGRIVHFNDVCEVLTGFCWAEVRGRKLDDRLLSRRETAPVEEVFRRHLAGENHLQHDNAWLDKNGREVAIHWESIALRGEDGQLEYILGIGSRRNPSPA